MKRSIQTHCWDNIIVNTLNVACRCCCQERNDLALIDPGALANMTAKLYAMIPTLYQSDIVEDNNGTYDCSGCLGKARGELAHATGTDAWFGPWLQ